MRSQLTRCLFCLSLICSVYVCVCGAVPPEVQKLAQELKTSGASVRIGASRDLGVFLVGIGRTRYNREAVDKCREIARTCAVNAIAEVMRQTVKAHDVVSLNMAQIDDKSTITAFVSSLTETSVNVLLGGVQDVEFGRNESEGEVEYVVYVAQKRLPDLEWDDTERRGCVRAIGIDAELKRALQNALRSAVEQVAGTMVVGKVSVNEREEMHRRLSTTAHGLVEQYRIVAETKIDSGHRIEIMAKVNKRKLYDSYRSFFKSLDNPTFHLKASTPELRSAFMQYFLGKGLPLTEDAERADYQIRLNGRFTERPNPFSPQHMGTQLVLDVEVVSTDGRFVLLAMSDTQAKDSLSLTSDQRRMAVCSRIFRKMKDGLDKAIHDMVVRMLDDADAASASFVEQGTKL